MSQRSLLMRRCRACVLLTTVVAALGVATDAQQPARTPGRAAAGELLVRFRSATSDAARNGAAVRARLARLARFAAFDIDHMRVNAGQSVDDALAALAADPDVLFAEPNYVREVVASGPPNDPYWIGDSLWGLWRIMAQPAWLNYPVSGPPVVIADIDSGVNYNHPDLAANMWRNPGEIPGNHVDDDHNGYVDDVFGIDTVNRDSDPMDDYGHGTHTAGTLAAVANNGIGVVGVNSNARILACKFINAAGQGTDAGAIACFNYIVALKNRGVNIRVSSNSWGAARTGSIPQGLQTAIDAASKAGILNVFAAGNAGVNTDVSPFDPASLPLGDIVAVAASDSGDNRASFSNYGAKTVDLAAPGVSIVSTVGGDYGYMSGTSMATPHVAGAASFLFAIQNGLSVSAARTLLLNSVDRLGNWSGVVASGGRLNLYGAALAAFGESMPPPPETSPDGTAVPPAPQIVDAQNNTWTIAANQAILRNGIQAAGGWGSKILWYGGAIYVLGTDVNWWQWNGGGWTNVGPSQPGGGGGEGGGGGGGGTTSPEGTTVPPASQIVDSGGAVWTIGANAMILRNGQHAAAGYGSQMLWTGGSLYVLGTDSNWWKWVGGGWSNVGPSKPGGGGSVSPSPDGTTVPPASQIVDAQGSVWTIGPDQVILRNGQQAAGGFGSEMIWKSATIYVFGRDSNWWKWNGGGWTNIGPSHP